jgi:hypothetical protein
LRCASAIAAQGRTLEEGFQSLFDGTLTGWRFILIVAPILTRYRHNPNVQGFIKGAYVASIGTILGGCVLLERSPSATGSLLWWRAPASASCSAGRSAIPARGRDGDHRAKPFHFSSRPGFS